MWVNRIWRKLLKNILPYFVNLYCIVSLRHNLSQMEKDSCFNPLYNLFSILFICFSKLQNYRMRIVQYKKNVMIESLTSVHHMGVIYLVLGFSDYTIGVHNLVDGNQLSCLKGHSGSILCLGVSLSCFSKISP